MNEAVELSRIWVGGKVVYVSARRNISNVEQVTYEVDKDARRILKLPRATWMSPEELMAAKAPKPGLFIVAAEGRYQGLGFNGEDL